MTRKDYIKLADLLGAAYAHVEQADIKRKRVRIGGASIDELCEGAAGKEALHIIQTGIEDICRQDNPRFNRDRFQDAINKACWTVAGPSAIEYGH